MSQMIDGLFKNHIDPLWERAARPLARHCTANQVTVIGLCAVIVMSAAYVVHGSTLWFGVGLIFAFTADSLDGAVARIRGEASRFGGYLDAIIDRYQEMAVLAVLALKTGHWPAAFLCSPAVFSQVTPRRGRRLRCQSAIPLGRTCLKGKRESSSFACC